MKKNQIPALLRKHRENLKSVVIPIESENKDLIYYLMERQLGLKPNRKKDWSRITGWEEDRGWSQAWVLDLGLETEQILFIKKPAKSSASQMNILVEYFVQPEMVSIVNW